MKRNEFLQTSLSAAGLALLGFSGTMLACDDNRKLPVGAHVWIYARDQPGYDVSGILPQIFSEMKYAGFDGIELMEYPLRKKETVQEIAGLIEEHQIPLLGTSYGANMWDKTKHSEITEDVENIMDHLAFLKARTFAVSVGLPEGRKKTSEEFDAQADILKKLIQMGNNRGIVLNLHNHTYEVEDNLFDLGNTLKRIPDVKLGPDLAWLERAGVNPTGFLKKFKKNIVFMHLRDQANNKWTEALGEGDTDFAAIGNTIREIQFNGDIVIELAIDRGTFPTRPVKELLKTSREYLKKTTGF